MYYLQGIILVVYIDDCILFSKSKTSMENAKELVINLK